MEEEQLARVIWRDASFIKDLFIEDYENWNDLLICWETIGWIKEKDGILCITVHRPVSKALIESSCIPCTSIYILLIVFSKGISLGFNKSFIIMKLLDSSTISGPIAI